jgi:hypothetical protein
MTAIINIGVALILVLSAINCLKRSSPYFSRQERFLLFLLVTGLFQTGGASFEGLNLSALRLLLWIVLAAYVVLAFKGRRLNQGTSVSWPIFWYSLFLGWCVLHLFAFSPDVIYGLRTILRLVYPFLILLLAYRVSVSSNTPAYLHLVFFATLLISVFTSGVSEKIPYLVYNPFLTGIFWPRATFADHAAIMVGVGLALWSSHLIGKPLFPEVASRLPRKRRRRFQFRSYFKAWQYKAAILWLCASPLAVANRTGLLATAGSIATFLAYKYKLKSIPFIVGIFFLGLWIVVYMPSFRESTFRDTRGVTIESVREIQSEDIDSSGRFAMWAHLMNRFYMPNQLVGAGMGAVQRYMYTMAETPHGPFGKLKVAHSAYVELLCDLGLIGFGLYLLTGFSALYLGMKAVFQKEKTERMLGLVVASSFVALFCAMGFDNVHLYALGVHQYPFAFLGMLMAVQVENRKRARLAGRVSLRR